MNSRDKQQGDPEICRESVTIPMVQEVYGSQPQICAGIGPTEHVRQMSEQELRRETLFEIRREIVGGLLPREEESLPNESKRALFYIDRELKKVSDYVRQQSAPDDLLELAIEMAIAYCNGFSPQIYPEIPKRPTPDDVRKTQRAHGEEPKP